MKRIKVLHVVSNLNRGGAETMIMNIYRNINHDLFQFDFLCTNNIDGDYESEIKEIGGNIYKIYDKSLFKRTKKILSLLKREKYDVIHSHGMFFSGYIQFLAFIAGIKKRITHSHSSSESNKNTLIRKIYHSFSKFLINLFTNIRISCGKDAGQYLYGKNKSYILLKNGIDLEKYYNVSSKEVNKLKKELKISNQDIIIGHVGSFQKLKNQIYFIDLAKELQNQNKKFKIVLVGVGECRNNVLETIKKEKLEDHFVLPGLRSDINIFMKMFDVFLMPSKYEGFPLTVVEALAGDNICFLSNNIPKETRLIDSRVYFFDLNEDKRMLVKKIFDKLENKKSEDIISILTEKGFSSKRMAEIISDIYLK